MPSSPDNVKLGPCSVTFNAVDLGYTKGGVEVEVATTAADVKVDQFGDSPIDSVITGRTVKVKVPMAESTLDNLVAIMPGAALVTDGVDSTKKKVTVPNGVGTSLRALAQKLTLHPQGVAANDKSQDFVVPLAMTSGSMSFAYKLDEERVFNVEFTGYPDETNGGLLYVYGDESATA
jgi:hypothetical protein